MYGETFADRNGTGSKVRASAELQNRLQNDGVRIMLATLRDSFSDALHYWEPRRLVYNAVLAAVTIFWFAWSWPHFRPAMNLGNLLRLMGLALIANVLYCAAYLVDIPLQTFRVQRFMEPAPLGTLADGHCFCHASDKLLD
jgi:hypothetical protein